MNSIVRCISSLVIVVPRAGRARVVVNASSCKMRTRGNKPLALRVYREVQTFKGSRAENREITLLGEYNFIHREELVEANNRKADASCYLLTIRHHKGQVLLLSIDAEPFESGCRNPRVVASGIDQKLGNNRAA